MKKMRIMVLALMVMAMAAGLLSGPAAAHAEGSTPEIALGAGEIAKATSTARNYTVWFGKYNNNAIQWRVLSGGGSTDPDDGANLPVSGTGEALLISKQILDVECYFKEDCSSNQWAGSDAQAWCTAFWNSSNWLTAAEKRAVNATTVNEQNNSSGWFYRCGYKNEYYSAAPLNGEHIFFLSAREADKLFTGDSDRQAQKVSVNQSWWWWWLRSPLTSNGIWSGYVHPDGYVYNSRVDFENGARPAFNLNLSSVLFSSLIQSNQYKLTLADSNRTIGIQPGAAITRDSATQITVPYTKDSGSNHVSLLITNKDDAWTAGSGWSTGAVKQYYATAAVSEANGTVTFTLPDNYETNKGNWQVWLLAEQVNGEHETDCASAPVAITTVAYVDAKGNTPADSPVVCTPVTASDTEWGAAGQTTWYAVTDSVDITSRVEVKGNVNLILCDGNTLTAKEGITVSGNNKSLTIWAQSGGTGILYAGTTNGKDSTCPQDNAAIGGGGYHGTGGKVTVNGGTVYALGGRNGAGIGGSMGGAGGEVTVNGGTVRARGGDNATGIGGSGVNGVGGKVTVTGGTVNATGGYHAAGIGGGGGAAGGEVTVTGGTVYATGNDGAAGIGGGSDGDGGTVKITGGTVYAQANVGSGQAIGHGVGKSTAGSLEIYAGAKVSAGENNSSASLVQDGTARVKACRDNEYAAIEPCENHSYTKYKNITDTTHTPVCAYCLNEGTATSHVYQDGECACGKQESYNVTLHTNGGTIASGKDVTGYTHGTGAALPTAADISRTGFTFNGWFDNENLTGSAVTAISATDTGNKIYWAKWTADPATAPVFTTQPQSVKLGLNAAGGNALTAATESISGHTITYRWYVNMSNSNDGGTPITGANAASYAAPTDELGTKYYYCVATATREDNGQTASTKSDPAAVEVLRFITHTVTFEVVGGSWDDEDKTTANQTVEFTYPDDDDFAPVLQAGQVPAVGSSPDAGHLTGGTWTEGDSVVTMPPDEAIRRDRTFTFTYTAKGQSAVAKAPEAKTLTYNGAAQALVTAGTATDGTMLYALGTEIAPGTDWSDAIPERTDAGTYYVWYKAQGDATHLDSEPKPVSAGIAPKAATVTASTQTVKEGESIQTGTQWATLTDALSGHTLSAVTLTAENGKIVPADAKIQDAKGNDVTGNYAVTYTPATLTALGKISRTVTFKVVNGSWDDGTNTDKTVNLTGFAGDTLKLAAEQIPAVGTKPGDAFKAGAWDVTPSTDAEITADTTYTYTYALRDAYLVTVTNDGRGTGSASPNSGYEGTEVLLTATPAQGYKFKEWQVVSGGVTIADNKFKLGKANVEVKAVFEAQATGWHKGEAKIKPGAPVIQCSNMQEVVESIIAAIQKREMKGISEEVRQAVLRPDAQVLVLFISAPLSPDQIPAEDWAALEQLQKDAGYTGIVPFDITLMLNVNGQDVAEVHETKIPVKFSVGIMENLLGTPRTFALVNVHNGAAKVLPTTRRGNFLDGESTEFSTYAIAYKDEETPTDTPAPTSTPAPVIDPAKFDDVAVPSDSFTFKKVWQGDSEKSIDFTLYRQDGTVYHHGFDKKVDSDREWQYDAWFSAPAACYVIEKPIPGYQTKYVNVGVYAQVTDRCCDGGTIINKKIPKTGDEANPVLWAGMMLAGIAGLTATIVLTRKRGKAGK